MLDGVWEEKDFEGGGDNDVEIDAYADSSHILTGVHGITASAYVCRRYTGQRSQSKWRKSKSLMFEGGDAFE